MAFTRFIRTSSSVKAATGATQPVANLIYSAMAQPTLTTSWQRLTTMETTRDGGEVVTVSTDQDIYIAATLTDDEPSGSPVPGHLVQGAVKDAAFGVLPGHRVWARLVA